MGNSTVSVEKLVAVVTDDGGDTSVGVFRGESVDGGGGRGSVVTVSGPVVPVGESTMEPIEVVSRKKRGLWARKKLTHGGTKEEGSQGEMEYRVAKPCSHDLWSSCFLHI